MADSCKTECDLKAMVEDMRPKVDKIHDILIGWEWAFRILKGTATVLISAGTILGLVWGAFSIWVKGTSGH